ncbi:cupin domain-containing protein [Methylopila henanensis]|uniref:Cupin domain-containing protein n=1 Tax=Methylopila henanensis TaxID=873516 RepID=A0ABW4KB87_9HYPH
MSGGPGSSAAEIIRELGLQPHPEGGHFRETFRDPATDAAGRSRSTAIYFLLAAGEASHWHRVDAVEVWHHYAGAPLELSLSADGRTVDTHRLGPDFAAGDAPQVVVPTGWWQAARSLGDWTLVGCTVAPGFDFVGFELAPPDWAPSARP